MRPIDTYQPFCVSETLLAADATKTLVAAGTGKTIVVTNLETIALNNHANACYIGDTSGNRKVLSLPGANPTGGHADVNLEIGYALTKGEALIIKPTAAGPSYFVLAEGYIKQD